MSLTHFDGDGHAHMVDVSDKAVTARIATAENHIKMQRETYDIITEGRAKKGDVLGVARLAGIMAAKKTSDLIPLCHPLPLTEVSVEITPDRKVGTLVITASAATTASASVSTSDSRSASMPDAAASSRDSVAVRSRDQRHARSATTSTEPTASKRATIATEVASSTEGSSQRGTAPLAWACSRSKASIASGSASDEVR